MQIKTRLHDSYDGSVARNVSSINFNTMSPGARSGKVILSLHVEGVDSLSDIVFEILPSEHIDLDTGALKYDKSMMFERKDNLASSFSSERRTVALRNINSTSSELLYLELDSSLGITAGGSFSCKWSFNYVPGSSSSSSSSSNLYVECTEVYTDDVVVSTLPQGSSECFIIQMEASEHSTIMMNGSPIENYNADGQIYLDEVAPILNDTFGLYLGGLWYSMRLLYTDNEDYFIVNLENVGVSSSSSEEGLNVKYELVTLTNSSSCSSSSSSSLSSSSYSSSSFSFSSSSSSFSSSSSSSSPSSSSSSSSRSSSSSSSSSLLCADWTSTLNTDYDPNDWYVCSFGIDVGNTLPSWDGTISYFNECEWRTPYNYWGFGVNPVYPGRTNVYQMTYARVYTTNGINWTMEIVAYYTFGGGLAVVWSGTRSGQGPYGTYSRTTPSGYCNYPYGIPGTPPSFTVS